MTGTPINTGLEDLYGLLLFLRAEPYNERVWWHKVCQQPYEQGSLAGLSPGALSSRSLLFFGDNYHFLVAHISLNLAGKQPKADPSPSIFQCMSKEMPSSTGKLML